MNGLSCWETVVECDKIEEEFYFEPNKSQCGGDQRVLYCTCKMRSPSRIRPSLAAMLFGLICEGGEGTKLYMKHFQSSVERV